MLVTLNYALGLVIVGRDGAAGTLLLYFALVPRASPPPFSHSLPARLLPGNRCECCSSARGDAGVTMGWRAGTVQGGVTWVVVGAAALCSAARRCSGEAPAAAPFQRDSGRGGLYAEEHGAY